LAARLRVEPLEERLAPAIHVWTGPLDGLWSNTANWNGGVPTNLEPDFTVVEFGNGTRSIDDIGGLAINEIHFTGSDNVIEGATSLQIGGSGFGQFKAEIDTDGGGYNLIAADLPIVVATENSPGLMINLDNLFTAAGTLEIASTISGVLPPDGVGLGGDGTLRLSANNTYPGQTLIAGGASTLALGVDDALPTGTDLNIAGTTFPTFDLNGFDQTVASIGNFFSVGTITDTAAPAVLTVRNNTDDTYNGVLTGSLTLVKKGTGTLTLAMSDDPFGQPPNDYTGPTILFEGRLVLGAKDILPIGGNVELGDTATLDLAGHDQSLGLIGGGAGTITSASSATLTLTPTGLDSFFGNITGAVALTLGGGQVLDLFGGITDYTGPTTVTGGTLWVDGHLTASGVTLDGGTFGGVGTVMQPITASSVGGTLKPGTGNPGTLNCGMVTLNAASTYSAVIGGVLPGSGYNQLISTDTVNLNNAALSANLIGAFSPNLDDTFTIIQCTGNGAINGTFQGLADGGFLLINGIEFRINYTPNSVVLTRMQAPAVGLEVEAQPLSVLVDGTFTLTVAVVDQFGQVVTNDNSMVTVAIDAGPIGDHLKGTLTVQVVNGIAVFSDLRIKKAGVYTLALTDGLLAEAVTDPILVLKKDK
jgi:autotransporter-associated beta strand protein